MMATGLDVRDGHHQGDGRSDRADHGRGAGAVRRVRALRIHQRHHRPVLPPVRRDHRRLDDHLGHQRHHHDAVAGRHDLQDRAEEHSGHEHGGEALPWWIFAVVGGLLTVWLGPTFLGGHLGCCRLRPTALSANVVDRASCDLVLPGALAGGVVGWFVIRPVNAVLGWFFRGFNRGFDRMTAVYGWTVGKLAAS